MSQSEVSHILGVDGPISEEMERRDIAFESRDQQITMAQRVDDTLVDRAHLLVEAGTGVGKSFAYLVPAMLRCMQQGERVVVATNTIALQEQLVSRDIPLLQATIEGKVQGEHPLMPVLVKGRGNYVSLRRLGLAHQRRGKLLTSQLQNQSLDVIQEWADSTEDGSRSTLPTLDAPEVWNHVQSDSDNCMGRKCPRYGECFYQNARRAAQSANLLICNHALFFSDLALRGAGAKATSESEGQAPSFTGILPEYDHVVLDEAHMVEDVASDHLGASLTEGRVGFLLRNLYDERRQKGYLAQIQLVVGDAKQLDQVIRIVKNATDASRVFFDQWAHEILSGHIRTGRVRTPGAVDNILSPAFRELALSLRTLRESISSESDRFELTSFATRATEMADAATILVDHKLEGCVYWAELSEHAPRGMRARVTLACAPVDVAPSLRELLFNRKHSVVLTSATLATASSSGDESPGRSGFSHLIERLGCEGAETLLLGSPFEFARQVRLYVDPSTPEPPGSSRDAAQSSNAYFDELTNRVLFHIEATRGGAFVLCTSFRTIRELAERLADPLARAELPLLVQGRDGPRSILLERFRSAENAVLLGAASFWQGVDVRGRALRNVTITRLPFDPPDRPLTEARGELIRMRGGNPFREDSLPRAIIRFKQGFGRLIRSGDDEGRVVVLDPRIATKSYGRMFLRALPDGVEAVDVTQEQVHERDFDF